MPLGHVERGQNGFIKTTRAGERESVRKRQRKVERQRKLTGLPAKYRGKE